MNINAQLAKWGEPPATSAEESFAAMLEDAMNQLEHGRGIRGFAWPGAGADLVQEGRQLLETVTRLYDCAARVREDSGVQAEDAADRLAPGMPDPFPGEFRFLRLLGEGAFGKVYLAQDLNLGWQVAIKTLKLAAESTHGPETLMALKAEARNLAKLNHPNIVRVHAWREAQGEYFLVEQYVEGGSLGDRLTKERSLTWQDAARYVADVGEALIAAHQGGVIHRDIKPDNILWDAEHDEAILTDFGIAARLAEPGSAAGTPMYMAPEAFQGVVTSALDVYSLAATLYRLMTGKCPFAKATAPELVRQKLAGLPDPDTHCQGMPRPLEQVLRAGLAGRAAQRPALADFVAALRSSLNHLLADGLQQHAAPVDIRLTVRRRAPDNTYGVVAAVRPAAGAVARDMKKVPPVPDRVPLRTGDCVRIEVTVDRAGFVTVFNVGPTGNLNLLYPEALPAAGNGPDETTANIQAHAPLTIADVEMTPPTGRERLVAVWSCKPLPLSLAELSSLTGPTTEARSPSYRASRDMKRVQNTVARLAPHEWSAAVLELEQEP